MSVPTPEQIAAAAAQAAQPTTTDVGVTTVGPNSALDTQDDARLKNQQQKKETKKK